MPATHPILKYFASAEEMDAQCLLMQRVHGQRLRFVGMDYPLLKTECLRDNLSLWCQHPDVDLDRVARLKEEPRISRLLALSPQRLSSEETLLAQLFRASVVKQSAIIVFDLPSLCNDKENITAILGLMLAHCQQIFIFASIEDKAQFQKLLW